MDRNYIHWGALSEIIKLIRDRMKSPETLRFVERRLEIARLGTMRRRYVLNAHRTIRVPSRPNKRSRKEIVEIDGELINRANRLGRGYQPIAANEIEQNEEMGI